MNRMSTADTAYLAGIFDGEGWFVSNDKNTCRVCVAMTDFDIVEKLYQTTGVGNLNLKDFAGVKKDQLAWVVNKIDDVEDLIYAMIPFLSKRRTVQAQEVLGHIQIRREQAEWRLGHFICGHDKVEDNTYHTNQGKTVCRTCSLERSKRAA